MERLQLGAHSTSHLHEGNLVLFDTGADSVINSLTITFVSLDNNFRDSEHRAGRVSRFSFKQLRTAIR